MLLELMNMATANLVYQNATIKPSRIKRRRNEEMKYIWSSCYTFAMLEWLSTRNPILIRANEINIDRDINT